jgi:hypothetical protein
MVERPRRRPNRLLTQLVNVAAGTTGILLILQGSLGLGVMCLSLAFVLVLDHQLQIILERENQILRRVITDQTRHAMQAMQAIQIGDEPGVIFELARLCQPDLEENP